MVLISGYSSNCFSHPDIFILSKVIFKYRVSQEKWTKLPESVPNVKLYRYNPKHLYRKLKVTEIMAIEKCGLLGCPRTVSRP